jgi:TPP-dependent pyruvate/acetoin dehydrogenase alpha subunit
MLTREQRLELFYWMILTRVFDESMVALWKQGRGLGGAFSQRGHEAISVGAAYALAPDDVIAPMHRDLGAYLLRGMTPQRIFGNLLGRANGVSGGRDANLHGMGDLNLNIIGFISHLPHSLPVALGAAMSFTLPRRGARALPSPATVPAAPASFTRRSTWRRYGTRRWSSSWRTTSTPTRRRSPQQMKLARHCRPRGGLRNPRRTVDGNDVEAVYAVTRTAVARARSGDGPTLIEAKTMRMLGHAIHDGAEYVPRDAAGRTGRRATRCNVYRTVAARPVRPMKMNWHELFTAPSGDRRRHRTRRV